jgi:hypothetical protein
MHQIQTVATEEENPVISTSILHLHFFQWFFSREFTASFYANYLRQVLTSSETPLLYTICVKAVFRIHDILVWIQIRGSMPLTNGSGSCYFRH